MSDRPLRIALLGTGRMGRAVRDLALERGHQVVAFLGRPDLAGNGGAGVDRPTAAVVDAGDDAPPAPLAEALAGADVAVELTAPSAAVAHIRWCVGEGCPVVVGTTGWHERLDEVRRLVEERDGALLWAANFSLGVAALRVLARRAGGLFHDAESFSAHVVETHHSGKLDAPSGTALALQGDVTKTLGRDVPITSVRVGHVPGTHELIFDGLHEQVVLRHVARDRRVFADGALAAAAWLPGHEGVFTMDDVLGLGGRAGHDEAGHDELEDRA